MEEATCRSCGLIIVRSVLYGWKHKQSQQVYCANGRDRAKPR